MRYGMNKPALYNIANKLQRNATLKYLKENAHKIQWKTTGDSVIDLGCGDGSLSTLVKKTIPSNNYKYGKFVACDISESMIAFAKEHYGHKDILFRVLDLEKAIPKDLKENFDHVYSFYTFHWIKNQETAFKNVYNLLADNGDIFIIFLATAGIHSIYKILSQQPKWQTWLKDVDVIFSHYHDMEKQESIEAAKNFLIKSGFTNFDVQCKAESAIFLDKHDLKNHVQSVDPFHMPQEVFDELIKDYISFGKQHGLLKNDIENGKEVNLTYEYRLLIITAKK